MFDLTEVDHQRVPVLFQGLNAVFSVDLMLRNKAQHLPMVIPLASAATR